MINLGYVTEDQIIEALARQLGVRLVDLSSMIISRETAAVIPLTLAERYTVIPIKKEDKKLTLAMVDPTNFFAIDDVQMVSGCEVEVVIAAKREILRAINQSYGVQDLVEKAVNKLQPADTTTSSEIQTTEDAPVISIVNSLISQAIKDRASDIHIEPQDNAVRVRFRVDGVLREVVTFPQHSHAAIISRVKIMSEMDIAEKRLPQDGRIKVQEDARDIDIRVSTLPTILGEKVVLRILDKNMLIVDSKGLGFSDDNFQRVQKLYAQSQGMILVTGPTGSGKTTTLYTTLAELNSVEKNIITIEDPVEYRLKGINQIQVNQKAGLTFASGLRSLLRQDPNIVMVGEVRDKETADIAIRAALTGHLVLSTLHTNNAPGAIIRLLDMGIEPFLVASSILGIIAQRLVRVICTECKQSYSPKFDSPERVFLGIASGAEVTLYRGAGCTHCEYTGYRGRIAIHEVMPTSSALREAIKRRASGDELAAIATKEGMSTIRDDGTHKVLDGLTTAEELMRVAYTEI
jgi:type IV pilus assembly protein PilB